MRDLVRRFPHPLERVPRGVWVVVGAAVAVHAGWFLTSNYRALVAERVRDARDWRIEGPPCPSSDRAAFLGVHHKPPRRFDYEGVAFFRRVGHVSCSPVYEKGGRSDRHYPVCQFTGPDDLMVRTRNGDWYFRPGPGQPATVSTQDGVARCVMAANFTIAAEMDAARR